MKYCAANFGKNLKELREQMGLSQSELAAYLGILPPKLSQWENDLRKPDLNSLCHILNSLPIKIERLLK